MKRLVKKISLLMASGATLLILPLSASAEGAERLVRASSVSPGPLLVLGVISVICVAAAAVYRKA